MCPNCKYYLTCDWAYYAEDIACSAYKEKEEE
jgi:hypothetical protein